MAAQGAQVVVLPEKIGGLLTTAQAQAWQRQMSGWAARYRVWLEAGVGVERTGGHLNVAWLFAPDGQLLDTYQKHYLAPPEQAFAAGQAYTVRAVAGQPVGLAICKDLHFAALGRAYARRRVGALLVPAWDFDPDGQLAERMTATHGVENGYLIVRAARNGLLTVSDAYGRVVAERLSRRLPGQTLLVRTPVSPLVPTLYTRLGDALGWLCVAAGAGLLLTSRGVSRRSESTPRRAGSLVR
ncbi:hypothetical protein B0919_08760 [Hymenobacter sp. CRA2]|nr:hypothetical protein B0919_08760 [Hymenobacter sp. CRA2]